jgi:hypothetical protein
LRRSRRGDPATDDYKRGCDKQEDDDPDGQAARTEPPRGGRLPTMTRAHGSGRLQDGLAFAPFHTDSRGCSPYRERCVWNEQELHLA